jgi:hypothetical protein
MQMQSRHRLPVQLKKKGIDRHEHADDNDSWDARALA